MPEIHSRAPPRHDLLTASVLTPLAGRLPRAGRKLTEKQVEETVALAEAGMYETAGVAN